MIITYNNRSIIVCLQVHNFSLRIIAHYFPCRNDLVSLFLPLVQTGERKQRKNDETA